MSTFWQTPASARSSTHWQNTLLLPSPLLPKPSSLRGRSSSTIATTARSAAAARSAARSAAMKRRWRMSLNGSWLQIMSKIFQQSGSAPSASSSQKSYPRSHNQVIISLQNGGPNPIYSIGRGPLDYLLILMKRSSYFSNNTKTWRWKRVCSSGSSSSSTALNPAITRSSGNLCSSLS
mgnify:CR=1 FL=1